MTPDQARSYAIAALQDAADFRKMMSSKDRPDDQHNAIYAKSLERLITYVEALPSSDSLLARLGKSLQKDDLGLTILDGGWESGSTELHTQTIHLGPRHQLISDEECREVFASWAESVIETSEACISACTEGDRLGRLWAARNAETLPEPNSFCIHWDDAISGWNVAECVYSQAYPESQTNQADVDKYWKEQLGEDTYEKLSSAMPFWRYFECGALDAMYDARASC